MSIAHADPTRPAPVSESLSPIDKSVQDEVALIACGRRENKLRSCARCAMKASKLIEVATADRPKPLVRLAAAICGSAVGDACEDCIAKATEILPLLQRETA